MSWTVFAAIGGAVVALGGVGYLAYLIKTGKHKK